METKLKFDAKMYNVSIDPPRLSCHSPTNDPSLFYFVLYAQS